MLCDICIVSFRLCYKFVDHDFVDILLITEKASCEDLFFCV